MKMHGAGNDFVVIDSRDNPPVSKDLARALGDRHRGVGFDQLAEILVGGDSADVGLKFWNSDGTVAGACGNATRCVAAHLMVETCTTELTLRTDRGLLQARLENGVVSVNMGQPQFQWDEIPLSEPADIDALPIEGSPSAVGMGNPHCVFFVDDVESVDVARLGAAIEHHALYPQATNVEFAEVRSASEIRMRVWERGTGITLACGSGACAVAVSAARTERTDRNVSLKVPSGAELSIEWKDNNHVIMTGPAEWEWSGMLNPETGDWVRDQE